MKPNCIRCGNESFLKITVNEYFYELKNTKKSYDAICCDKCKGVVTFVETIHNSSWLYEIGKKLGISLT